MKKLIMFLLPSAVLLVSAGCGSGSSVTLPRQKTATVIFSASTSAALPTAVRVIRISARLPAGVSVPLKPNSAREVDPGALVVYKPGSTVLGNYSAPLLIIGVTGDQTPSSSGLGATNVGDFVGVKTTFDAGLLLTEGSFTSINSPFPDFKATGYPTPGTTVSLTNQLKPAMRVTF